MPLRTAVKSINVNAIMVFDHCQRLWDKLPRDPVFACIVQSYDKYGASEHYLI